MSSSGMPPDGSSTPQTAVGAGGSAFRPELQYLTPPPHRNASTMVKLAGIFNLVIAGTDLIAGMWGVGMAIFFWYMTTHDPTFLGASKGGATPPPTWLFPLMYGVPGLLSFLIWIPKAIGGIKLLRCGDNAWIWGFIAAGAGLGSLVQMMTCSFFCVLPLAVGVFTLVAMLTGETKQYLAEEYARRKDAQAR